MILFVALLENPSRDLHDCRSVFPHACPILDQVQGLGPRDVARATLARPMQRSAVAIDRISERR
jgi:hypothetical protein